MFTPVTLVVIIKPNRQNYLCLLLLVLKNNLYYRPKLVFITLKVI